MSGMGVHRPVLNGEAPELLAALKWAEKQLRALVTEDDEAVFIRSTGTELAGFSAGMRRIRAAIARAESEV